MSSQLPYADAVLPSTADTATVSHASPASGSGIMHRLRNDRRGRRTPRHASERRYNEDKRREPDSSVVSSGAVAVGAALVRPSHSEQRLGVPDTARSPSTSLGSAETVVDSESVEDVGLVLRRFILAGFGGAVDAHVARHVPGS